MTRWLTLLTTAVLALIGPDLSVAIAQPATHPDTMDVRRIMGRTAWVVISDNGPPVERTVAEALTRSLAPEATVIAARDYQPPSGPALLVSAVGGGEIENPGNGFYGHRRRLSRNYDAEESVKELARLGASHVVVNALPQPTSMEQGPRGEVYYRFEAPYIDPDYMWRAPDDFPLRESEYLKY